MCPCVYVCVHMDTSAQRNMKIHPREVTKLPLVLGLLGGDGIPAELFQILKDDAISAALSMPANLENSALATGLEKVSFHSSP